MFYTDGRRNILSGSKTLTPVRASRTAVAAFGVASGVTPAKSTDLEFRF